MKSSNKNFGNIDTKTPVNTPFSFGRIWLTILAQSRIIKATKEAK